jgi:hypothetical protein
MSAKMTTGAAAGVAAQIVVVLVWIASRFHFEVPNEVAIALTGILTWLGGLLLHPPEPSAGGPSPGMTPIVRSLILVAAALAAIALASAPPAGRGDEDRPAVAAGFDWSSTTFFFDRDLRPVMTQGAR